MLCLFLKLRNRHKWAKNKRKMSATCLWVHATCLFINFNGHLRHVLRHQGLRRFLRTLDPNVNNDHVDDVIFRSDRFFEFKSLDPHRNVVRKGKEDVKIATNIRFPVIYSNLDRRQRGRSMRRGWRSPQGHGRIERSDAHFSTGFLLWRRDSVLDAEFVRRGAVTGVSLVFPFPSLC